MAKNQRTNTTGSISPEELVSRTYALQIRNSKKRGHPLPEYTFEEFREWAFKNKKFNDLYSEWIESGFEQDYKPSCDRILDTIGYRLDNLQWVTYTYNRAKPKMTQQKRLVLLNEHKQPIALFYGIINAEKLLGKSADTIRRYVNKKTLNDGYYWVILD